MKEQIEEILKKNFRRYTSGTEHWDNANVILAVTECLNELHSISKSLTPHRCPICGGNGLVSGAFYTSLLGCGGTSANTTEQCRSCNGVGILYS